MEGDLVETNAAPGSDPAATTDVKLESSTSTPDVSANSSTADDAVVNDRPKSSLDAVNAALDAMRKPAEGATPSEGEKEKTGEPKPEAANPAEAEAAEEKADRSLPFKDHPTWKASVTERRTLREANRELKAKVADYEARFSPEVVKSHETMQQLTSFMQQHGLGDEEVDTGLAIMGWMKTDPVRALQAIEPYYRGLLQVTGNIMPEDIRTRVDQGLVDQETAQELARQRAEAALSRNREAMASQRAAEVEHRTRADAFARQVTTAVGQLEKVWQTSDPDYPRKQQLVADRIALDLAQNGAPRSIQDATERATKAKQAVDQMLAGFRPAPSTIHPPQRGTASVSAAPKPKNTLDVINSVLGA